MVKISNCNSMFNNCTCIYYTIFTNNGLEFIIEPFITIVPSSIFALGETYENFEIRGGRIKLYFFKSLYNLNLVS